MIRIFLTLFLFITFITLAAQNKTVVSGKVIDATTGSPVPFATVQFVGTTEGDVADFEGNYLATTTLAVDSIQVSYVGYKKKTKIIVSGTDQIINFQLQEDVTLLQEVVISPGVNPALAIMRNVINQKKKNDKRALEAYEYESYTRTEIDIDNISQKMKERKMMQRISNVIDSIEVVAGDDGKPLLPVFISESISKFHYRKNPVAKQEHILHTRVKGLGLTDGTLMSQIVGSSFQEYNFYQNWMNVVSKDFASPIADSWKLLYEYELKDSLYIDDELVYLLEFTPKQAQDLAFNGNMWITKKDFAIKRIDAEVNKSANLNFLEKLKIQQELERTSSGSWIPTKTRVVIDVSQLSKGTAGLISKFYVSNKNVVINQPRPDKFYFNPITIEDDAQKKDPSFWSATRHDSLTATEENVFLMIDTVNKIPQVRFMTDLLKFIGSGYYSRGKIDIGPYTTFIGLNDIEGFRIGFGARTNINFSKKWVLGGYLGYGFDDEEYKYDFYTKHILNRTKWTTLQFEHQRDVEQIWTLTSDIPTNSILYSLSRFGTLRLPFLRQKSRVNFSRQLFKGLGVELGAKHETQTPLFDFTYVKNQATNELGTSYSIAEGSIAIDYGKDELFVINDNDRVSLGTQRAPSIRLKYDYGSNQFRGSFTYHRLQARIKQKLKLGIFGETKLRLNAGYMIGEVPYTLLFNPLGNETPFYSSFTYNLMDFFEFSSDRFVELKMNHSFEGFFFNRIPLLKKLKLRSILSASAIYGDISQSNIDLTPLELDENGEQILPFREWRDVPYIEVGYGVSNIARVFSVQAFHRLTYTDNNANRFGVKFSIDLAL